MSAPAWRAPFHMPYMRVGAMKVSDHWVRSPLLNVDNACRTCHVWPEDELRQRVHAIQDRTYEIRNIAIDAVLDLSRAIAEQAAVDSTAAFLPTAPNYDRKAQFLTDFVEAENSMGFHADQESVRVLAQAINYARPGLAAVDGRTLDPTRRHDAAPQTVTPPGGTGDDAR